MLRLLALLLALAPLASGGAGPPQRVVSQTVGTDDILMALAEPARIAALSHMSRDVRYSPSLQKASRFPALRTGDAEDVLRFRPDLVLVASYTQAETLMLLRRARVNLLVVERFETLQDLYANTRRIARALGLEAKGEALVETWRRRVEDLDRRMAGAKPVRVLAVGLYPFTAGAGTTFQDICDHAGALNVAAEAGLQGHHPTPIEQAIAWKVDVLVAPGEPGLDMAARLRETPPYKYIKALRQGRLVELPGSLMATTSQARLDAYEWLARALHPERFQ